jgi:hypothetical protein
MKVKTENLTRFFKITNILYISRIALLKLSRPIEWSPTIAPVCLPNDDEQTLQTLQGPIKCVSSGFGSQSSKGKLSSKMQQVCK